MKNLVNTSWLDPWVERLLFGIVARLAGLCGRSFVLAMCEHLSAWLTCYDIEHPDRGTRHGAFPRGLKRAFRWPLAYWAVPAGAFGSVVRCPLLVGDFSSSYGKFFMIWREVMVSMNQYMSPPCCLPRPAHNILFGVSWGPGCGGFNTGGAGVLVATVSSR